MVEDSGKTPGTDTCPVNTPEPVVVEEDASGLPVAVKTRRRQPVTAIGNRWRIDDEWWRNEPISRLYYAVQLRSGQKLVVYKDLTSGGWYRQPY